MKIKEIKTIIESDLTFMTDPKVEFVSMVKHGANRMPFKVLKYDKGGNVMKGIVQAVLLSKSLPQDQVDEILKSFKTEEVKEFETYKRYTQRNPEDFEGSSFEVTTEKEGVFYILGKLKETVVKAEEDVEKDLDYATMDDLYMALYAMADMVSGAMRQENASSAFKKKTILGAIDNFRNFAETLLTNLKEIPAVKAENHPNLPSPIVSLTDPKKTEGDDPPDPNAIPTKTPGLTIETLLEPLKKEIEDRIGELKESISMVSKALEDAVSSKAEEIKSLKDEIEELKANPVAFKTEKIEPPPGGDKDKSVFSGIFYKNA